MSEVTTEQLVMAGTELRDYVRRLEDEVRRILVEVESDRGGGEIATNEDEIYFNEDGIECIYVRHFPIITKLVTGNG